MYSWYDKTNQSPTYCCVNPFQLATDNTGVSSRALIPKGSLGKLYHLLYIATFTGDDATGKKTPPYFVPTFNTQTRGGVHQNKIKQSKKSIASRHTLVNSSVNPTPLLLRVPVQQYVFYFLFFSILFLVGFVVGVVILFIGMPFIVVPLRLTRVPGICDG